MTFTHSNNEKFKKNFNFKTGTVNLPSNNLVTGVEISYRVTTISGTYSGLIVSAKRAAKDQQPSKFEEYKRKRK